MTKLGGGAIVSAIMGPGLNTHFAQLPRAGQLTMQTSDIRSMVTSHNETPPHGHQSVNGVCLRVSGQRLNWSEINNGVSLIHYENFEQG